MLTCPACHAENEPSAAACASCGRALPLGPGSVVAGRYEVLKLLGQGGMGMVFKARDRELDEVVALKVLRSDAAVTPELGRRFRAEIKMARRVTHRNVCRIHEYGLDGELQYISMAFVDGEDLKHVLKRQGPLTAQQAYAVGIAVAQALQAVHEEGIVHRDLKTANVMRDTRGVVRLMDFGIAKQTEEGAPGLTATGMIVGTPEYMSPEQCRGDAVDVRSDVYSLGVVVYELFTGRLPFRGDTAVATIIKHLQEPPPLANPLLPKAAVPVLAKALAKNPADRYASAADLAQALATAQAAAEAAAPASASSRAAGSAHPAPAEEEATAIAPQASAEPTELTPAVDVAAGSAVAAGAAGAARGGGRRPRPALALGAVALAAVVTVAAGGYFVAGSLRRPGPDADAAGKSGEARASSAPTPGTTAFPLVNPAASMKVSLGDEDGRSTYRIGEKARLVAASDTAGFLYLLAFTGRDEAVCIFPNARASDNRIVPGAPRRFVVPATGPAGRDLLVALVSTTPLALGGKPRYTQAEVVGIARGSTGAWTSAVLPVETTQ